MGRMRATTRMFLAIVDFFCFGTDFEGDQRSALGADRLLHSDDKEPPSPVLTRLPTEDLVGVLKFTIFAPLSLQLEL